MASNIPDDRLSNVIGAPFSEFVLTQLAIRAEKNSTGTGNNPLRTSDEILFLANKMSWVRFVSSVRIDPKQYQSLTEFYNALNLGSYTEQDALAKNWILQAGTSYVTGSGNNLVLREGIGPDNAYGLGGITDLGYRPMPGLTNVQIESKGSLGSLRQAVINFKVWNIEQLNVIEALYFRLGYSMLLEWGHVQYYQNTDNGSFVNSMGGIDPFEANLRKEIVQQKIAKKVKDTFGNYDGMLGIVQNFEWSFNQEGGYDCTVKLIGLGSILDSLRINLSYKLPSGLLKAYEKQQANINAFKARLDELARQNQILQQQINQGGGQRPQPLPPVVTNATGIYEVYKADTQIANPAVKEPDFLASIATYPSYQAVLANQNSVPDYYYKAVSNPASDYIAKLNRERTGYFLSAPQKRTATWQRIPGDVSIADPQPVALDKNMVSYNAGNFGAAANTINVISNFALTTNYVIPEINRYIPLSKISFFTPNTYYYELVNLKGPNNLSTTIGSLFDYRISKAVQADGLDFTQEGFSFVYAYEQSAVTIDGKTENKPYYFCIKFTPANNTPYTAAELATAVNDWFKDTTQKTALNITFLELYKLDTAKGKIGSSKLFNDVLIKGTMLGISVPNKPAPNFEIITNNAGFISTVLPRPSVVQAQAQQGQGSQPPINNGNQNTNTANQSDNSNQFASALHAMLNIIKSEVQNKAIKEKNSVFSLSTFATTETMFKDGVLDGVLTAQQVPLTAPPFDLIKYALKGFNSNLMTDPTLYDKVDFVNFNELCKAYAIRYENEEGEYFNFPIYIKFGYLLAFMNSMCLVYDSTQDKTKHPFVYLDFNPETNFCLTLPQHFTVDPLTCIIPYNGTATEYLELFPPGGVRTAIENLGEDKRLSSKTNKISGYLPGFKSPTNNYQGKTMEILLNVDFLLSILKSFTSNDPTNTVNLKGFLDAVVTGVNKSLGNINLFRVSYRDDSNTVIIKDDQFVPGSDKETALMIIQKNYENRSNSGIAKYGQLPVFGQKSLVTQMELKTNISTNISKQIAISAQANTEAVNSTDHSSFSYLNVDFVDRYKPEVVDATKLTDQQSASGKKVDTVKNDIEQAEKFNVHMLSIYNGGEYVVKSRTELAINYYINSMAGVKSQNPITKAAPFIPANLNITIDGISGIVMGNAFTIPEDKLPLSLRGTNGLTKVGFIVSGLTHTLDNNRWMTSIKGQMIKLRDSIEYTAPSVNTPGELNRITPIQVAAAVGAGAGPYPGACPPESDGKGGFIPNTGYSGAKQVLAPDYVGTDNFKTYYPNYTFIKGKSNINLAKANLTPLTEGEIVDDTKENRFLIGTLAKSTPTLFVVHHTGGWSSQAQDTYETFYCRGLPAQYVIDRAGVIHRFMPDGAKGWHAGTFNSNSIGVEVMARTDNNPKAPVLDVQVRAAVRLAQYLGFTIDQIVGHGEIAPKDKQGRPTKMPEEGQKIVKYIRTLT